VVTLGYAATLAVKFGSNLILTHLLFPAAFGLMLLVNVFLGGIQLFSDLGIGTSVVQNPRSDRAFLDTAWTLQVARGLVLFVVMAAIAWPYAAAYGEPMLAWMIPVAGLTTLADGFVSTKLFVANRELRMVRLQVVELVIQLAASLVMIVAAWITRSVWALVAGVAVGGAVRLLLSNVLFPGPRNRLRWERSAASGLLHFGKWVFVSSVVTFLAQQGDRLVFGSVLPMARLGVYNIAVMLCEIPGTLVSSLAFKIVFPLFSELRRTSADVNAAWRNASAAVALLGGSAALFLFFAGPYAVQLLYDDRYAEAMWMLRLLALGVWGTSLVHLTASVVLAGGQVKWLAAANAVRVVWVVGVVPLALWRLGFEAAVVAVALADLPRYVVLGLACRAAQLHIFAGDLRRTLVLGAAAGAGWLVVQLGPTQFLPAAAACVLGFAVWVAGNAGAVRWALARVRSRGGARG
jgi:O-antigen/teichoic acid export membrane protein